MKRLSQRLCFVAAVCLAVMAADVARADVFYTLGANCATIQPGGPRPGDNGKFFFNVEGRNNGDFASYGVLDFDASQLGLPRDVQSLNYILLIFEKHNAAFSRAGTVRFYLTEDFADIEPGTSTLIFDANDPPTGLSNQLQPRTEFIEYLVGGQVPLGMSGDYDVFLFVPPLAAEEYIKAMLNARSYLRLIVAPGDDDVAATWAGVTHTTRLPPLLWLDVNLVP